MKIEFRLEQFQNSDKSFFVEMLPYISPAVQKVQREGDAVFAEAEEQHVETVKQKAAELTDMIRNGSLNGKEVKIKTLEDHSHVDPLNQDPIFEDLLKSGSVTPVCDGVYAYSGLFLQIYRYFTRKIEDFARREFQLEREYEFPVLYPIDKYEQGGYFETFPHYMMFQTTMKNDLEILDRFSKNGAKDPSIFEEMKAPSLLLRHAACAPLYQILSGSSIPDDEVQAYLVSGRCFRNESGNVYEMARLNEFTMKEFVFVGAPKQCNEMIARAKQLWSFWRDTFRLNCKVNTANDSFFASNYKKLQFFQMLGDSKQEWICRLDQEGKEISAGSANFHRTHFSKPYGIRMENGNYAYTACFAFGVERLAYALLCQKGLDPDRWDHETLEEMRNYEIEL